MRTGSVVLGMVLFCVASISTDWNTAYAEPEKKERVVTITNLCRKEFWVVGYLKYFVDKGEWDGARKLKDSIAAPVKSLSKSDPPKGSKQVWQEFSDDLEGELAAVFEAVEKKDADKYDTASRAMRKSCLNCHEVYKK